MTSAKKNKALCHGCRDDFYNTNPQHQGCWSYHDSTVVEHMFVHIDRTPPYKWEGVETLSCHRKPKHATVAKNALDANGYWKSWKK